MVRGWSVSGGREVLCIGTLGFSTIGARISLSSKSSDIQWWLEGLLLAKYFFNDGGRLSRHT